MSKRDLSPHHLGLLITVGCAISFGAWPSGLRATYAEGCNAVFAILAVTLARLGPLLALCALQKRSIFRTRADIRDAFTGGFFQAAASVTILGSVVFLPGPLAIVIIYTHTLMMLLYMIARGEIKADLAIVSTTATALVGISLVLDLWQQHVAANWTGIGMALLGAVALASRTYAYGHQLKKRHPAVVGAENFIMALLFLPLLLFFQRPEMPHSLAGWSWLALGCAAQALGTIGQFYAINLLGSFRFSLFMKLEPLFTTIFAALLIGEYLKILQYFGIALVIGSLALYQWVEHARRKRAKIAEIL
jgi:drug/metabolite transporter (DMT)-like permease